MRTDYRFFGDNSDYIHNILYFDENWPTADCFLLSEVLFFLALNRKKRGEIGFEGYFATDTVCSHLQRVGYDAAGVLSAINHLLRHQLIIADHLSFMAVSFGDCVKIQASGYIHLRVLSERIEYLYGVIPGVPISDNQTVVRLAGYIRIEADRGNISVAEKVNAVNALLRYLQYSFQVGRERNPFYEPRLSGGNYILRAMERAVSHYYQRPERYSEPDLLDFV